MLPLVLGLIVQRPSIDTFGKSDAQILAMGREAWMRFYESRGGRSMVAYRTGLYAYGDVLARRNSRLLAKTDARRRRRLARALRAFGDDAVEVGWWITLGGTFWNTRRSETHVDTEGAILALVRPPARPAPAWVVSDVTKELRKVRASFKPHRWIAKETHYMNRLQTDWQAVLREAQRLSRPESDRVLDHCREVLRAVQREL